ncbi:hypothetical protein F5884DRAFT_787748 [Xylogone sp. PMI_703]|nr:hypothetical protein F5884DRAFT_787748 [Xylogone sp. PMI_703]
MFSSSVRRVAISAPSTPVTTSITSSAPRATTSRALKYRHQRRYSSSKPSSPPDGSKGVTGGQDVAAAPAQRPESGKKSGRTGRRKTKEESAGYASRVKDETLHNLPSVPSTQHIAPNQICASAFFSLHRPISLTQNFPKVVTDEAFAAIFTSRIKSNKASEVITTLTNTLESLDLAAGNAKAAGQQDQWNPETDELRAAITAESYRKAETHHLDGPPNQAIQFPTQFLTASSKYQPFHPPPPPKPMDTPESLAAGAEAAESQSPQHRTYTAVLTIEESTDANGDITYMAHSSPLVVEEPPATPKRFLERMNIRQERYEEYREQRADETGMLAISVKRQRKLKMKKHKYKKLMKRTRTLRRRLERS